MQENREEKGVQLIEIVSLTPQPLGEIVGLIPSFLH